MKHFLLLGLLAITINSCGLDEMMDKTNKMTTIIKSNCDCDDVRLLNYEDIKGGNTTAYFEIVGADIELHKKLASEINDSLKANFPDYCKIDDLTLDFINKGNHNKISIQHCAVIE